MMYEVAGACSSTVATPADDMNRGVVHARNLDFGVGWMDIKDGTWTQNIDMHRIMVNLRWWKNGKVVFQSAQFAGFIGVLTVSVARSATQWTRASARIAHTWTSASGSWAPCLTPRTSMPLAWLIRQELEKGEETTYAEVVKKLQTVQLLGPATAIVGGVEPDEGIIIARGSDNIVVQHTIAQVCRDRGVLEGCNRDTCLIVFLVSCRKM